MAIANVISIGTTAALSSIITVNAGQSLRLALKGDTPDLSSDAIRAGVLVQSDLTGVFTTIGVLNRQNPSLIVKGPATVAVRKAAGPSFGVFSDSSDVVPWSYAAANLGIVNTTTAVTIKAAAGAGLRNYISAIQVMAEALGTATELAIRDGAAGTVLWRQKIGTSGITGGLNVNFASPLRGTTNTLLEVVTLTASTTGAVYFNAQGFVDK